MTLDVSLCLYAGLPQTEMSLHCIQLKLFIPLESSPARYEHVAEFFFLVSIVVSAIFDILLERENLFVSLPLCLIER